MKFAVGSDWLKNEKTSFAFRPDRNTVIAKLVLSHLKHIGKDKEVGKDSPLLPHCKQPNDPGEAQQRDQDDGGLQQLPAWYNYIMYYTF